jgi:hypothetical protein
LSPSFARCHTCKLGTCHSGAWPTRLGRPPMRRPSGKRIRIHRIPLHDRDDAFAPLQTRRDSGSMPLIYEKRKRNIFAKGARQDFCVTARRANQMRLGVTNPTAAQALSVCGSRCSQSRVCVTFGTPQNRSAGHMRATDEPAGMGTGIARNGSAAGSLARGR